MLKKRFSAFFWRARMLVAAGGGWRGVVNRALIGVTLGGVIGTCVLHKSLRNPCDALRFAGTASITIHLRNVVVVDG